MDMTPAPHPDSVPVTTTSVEPGYFVAPAPTQDWQDLSPRFYPEPFHTDLGAKLDEIIRILTVIEVALSPKIYYLPADMQTDPAPGVPTPLSCESQLTQELPK